MAKIENAKGRKEGGGYERVFEGNKQLGHLMSRVHAASISAGTELVRILKDRLKKFDNLDDFITWDMREEGALMPEGVFIANRQVMQKCETLDFAGLYPDFIIFKRIGGKQECHLVEMKDGDAFDTQKASDARQDMYNFMSGNRRFLPEPFENAIPHFCCFNQNNKEAIVRGFKEKIHPDEAMTGREFCELVGLDYESILELRKPMAEGNISYFLRELLKIPEVKENIVQELNIG